MCLLGYLRRQEDTEAEHKAPPAKENRPHGGKYLGTIPDALGP